MRDSLGKYATDDGSDVNVGSERINALCERREAR